MWCAVCGAYADTTSKLLTLACRGDPEGKPQLRGMLLQKNCLLRNVHPVTKKELPPPSTGASQLPGEGQAGGQRSSSGAQAYPASASHRGRRH